MNRKMSRRIWHSLLGGILFLIGLYLGICIYIFAADWVMHLCLRRQMPTFRLMNMLCGVVRQCNDIFRDWPPEEFLFYTGTFFFGLFLSGAKMRNKALFIILSMMSGLLVVAIGTNTSQGLMSLGFLGLHRYMYQFLLTFLATVFFGFAAGKAAE